MARHRLQIPGPGDVRHCLSTLAGEDSLLGSLMEIRMSAPDSDFDGMAVGNVMLGALTQSTGSLGAATQYLTSVLGVTELVLPVSVDDIHLAAVLADGQRVVGELEVRQPGKAPISHLEVEGGASGVWPPAADALRSADLLVVGPGSLWTSIGGVLAVPGVAQALNPRAVVAFVCNTTTQPGQTDSLDFIGHVKVVTALLKRLPDLVIANLGRLDPTTEQSLAKDGLSLIFADNDAIQTLASTGTKVIAADLLASQVTLGNLWQKLHTAYHDMDRVAAVIGTGISALAVGE